MSKQKPTHAQALTYALTLAITAPTNKHAGQAIALAEEIARGMSPEEIEACKTGALELLEMEPQQ
jgi:hypothetical protein